MHGVRDVLCKLKATMLLKIKERGIYDPKLGLFLREKSSIRCTKQATYKTVALLACSVLLDNKGVVLKMRIS